MLFRRHDSEIILYLRTYPWSSKFFEVKKIIMFLFCFLSLVHSLPGLHWGIH
jgi:hypothetical protein